MKKLAKTIFTSSLFVSSLANPLVIKAQTNPWTDVCVGGAEGDVATIQGLQCLLANVFSISLTALGITGFVMMIVGSFKWLLSGGNSQHVESAKKTLSFAFVGLIVALSSFVIIRLIAEFTGVSTIMNFTIPNSSKDW